MNVKRFVMEHYDDILTSLTIVGIGATVGCTAKAVRNIDSMWDTNFNDWCGNSKPQTIQNYGVYHVEKAKVCWKEYVRIFIPVAVTTSSVLLMHHNHKKTAAILTASFAACQQAYDELANGAKDALGPKKFDELKSKILGTRADSQADIRKEMIDNKPVRKEGEAVETLIYDETSDRYFYGDLELIRRKVIEDNQNLTSDLNWLTYTDFMNDIGQTGTKLGNYLGWEYNPRDPQSSLIDVDFTADIKCDTPYVIMSLNAKPLPMFFTKC